MPAGQPEGIGIRIPWSKYFPYRIVCVNSFVKPHVNQIRRSLDLCVGTHCFIVEYLNKLYIYTMEKS